MIEKHRSNQSNKAGLWHRLVVEHSNKINRPRVAQAAIKFCKTKHQQMITIKYCGITGLLLGPVGYCRSLNLEGSCNLAAQQGPGCSPHTGMRDRYISSQSFYSYKVWEKVYYRSENRQLGSRTCLPRCPDLEFLSLSLISGWWNETERRNSNHRDFFSRRGHRL